MDLVSPELVPSPDQLCEPHVGKRADDVGVYLDSCHMGEVERTGCEGPGCCSVGPGQVAVVKRAMTMRCVLSWLERLWQ